MIKFFSILLCLLSSDSFIQHVWVGSYDFGFRFIGIPSCDCVCFAAIYCAWVVEISEIVHSLFPMHQFIYCKQSFFCQGRVTLNLYHIGKS